MMYKYEASDTGSYIIGSRPALPSFDIFLYDGKDLDAAKAVGFSYFSSMAAFMDSYGLTFIGPKTLPPDEQPSLSVSPESLTFADTGGTQTLTVTTTAEKFSMGVALPGAYFCKATAVDKTITVDVAANTSDEERSTVIGISVGDQVVSVPVTQGPKVITVTVDPSAVTLSATGSSSDVTVTTNAETWSAVVVEGFAWCTLSQGEGKLTITGSENTVTTQRLATVRVTADGKTADINVTQEGAAVIFSVNKTAVSLPASGSSDNVEVTTNATFWFVEVVEPEATWCTVEQQGGKAVITAVENTDAASRTATVRISAENRTADIIVTQAGAVAP